MGRRRGETEASNVEGVPEESKYSTVRGVPKPLIVCVPKSTAVAIVDTAPLSPVRPPLVKSASNTRGSPL